MHVLLFSGVAKALDTPAELLIGEDEDASTPTVPPRRTRRSPVSRLEQQLDAITRLPRAQQKAVSTVLDAVLAQHQGQEAATAP